MYYSFGDITRYYQSQYITVWLCWSLLVFLKITLKIYVPQLHINLKALCTLTLRQSILFNDVFAS